MGINNFNTTGRKQSNVFGNWQMANGKWQMAIVIQPETIQCKWQISSARVRHTNKIQMLSLLCVLQR
jgi:hypothetical protein